MPRSPRIALPGDIVHVVARGVRQEPIYMDDADRRHFMCLLRGTAGANSWECLTYCLMGNHYHLVVQLGAEPSLSVGMRDLNGAYARWHNDRHGRGGHLFEGRFWSKAVRHEAHMIGLARYVALNPVRAGLVAEAARWRWSAHRALIGDEIADFVNVTALLSHFDTDLARARRGYIAAVGAADAGRESATDPRLLEVLAWPDTCAAVARAHTSLGYDLDEIARVLGWTRRTVRRRLDRASASTKGARPLW